VLLHKCTLILSDGNLLNTYQFNIEVTNSAPRFKNGGQPKNIIVKLNDTIEYEIANLIDDEDNTLSVISKEKPIFATISGVKYVFKPTLPSHIGTFNV
jgi:hypothetical protein